MSMQTSSRLYHCCRCHAQVIICRRCDRGQRYCTQGCSQSARKDSLKRANKKYQASRKGRFNNAARQQRFRQHQQQKVTQQCSLQIPPHAVLLDKPNGSNKRKNRIVNDTSLHCDHCGVLCGPFLRSDYLKNSRFKSVLRRHYVFNPEQP